MNRNIDCGKIYSIEDADICFKELSISYMVLMYEFFR